MMDLNSFQSTFIESVIYERSKEVTNTCTLPSWSLKTIRREIGMGRNMYKKSVK